MVSSLPFLAPVFVRKAKEYRSKTSSGSGGNRGFKNGDHYKLKEITHDKGIFPSNSTNQSGSQENILGNSTLAHQQSIVKSVTYTIQVDEDIDGKVRRRDRDF